MDSNTSQAFALTARRRRRATLRAGPWLGLVALFAGAMILRQLVPGNADVKWLLTAAERVLDGHRLYVDLIETNPPMAVLTYVPGIVLARALDVPVAIVTDVLVFAAAFASLALVCRILGNGGALGDVAGWPFLLVAFAVLTIVPGHTFGQREHIVVIGLLPIIALYAVRMHGGGPPLWAAIAGGIGAGLAMSFKPHFAIAVLCGLASCAFCARSWRIAFVPENWIAGAVVATYALCVVFIYPEYLSDIVPMVSEVYLRIKVPFIVMFSSQAVPIWAVAGIAALILKRRGNDGAVVLLLAVSCGFVLVFFLQRKGWPYHSYPMIAFAMLGLGYALNVQAPRPPVLRRLAIATAAIGFVQSAIWFNGAFDTRQLHDSIVRVDPHPRMLAITDEPGLGHPLVRELQGTWVSRQQGLWVSGYLRRLRRYGLIGPAQEAAIARYAAKERAMLIEDIRKIKPTVVLVDNSTDHWSSWLAENPDVADLLKDYRLVATIDDIEIRAKPR